jgi:hypothetical protein
VGAGSDAVGRALFVETDNVGKSCATALCIPVAMSEMTRKRAHGGRRHDTENRMSNECVVQPLPRRFERVLELLSTTVETCARRLFIFGKDCVSRRVAAGPNPLAGRGSGLQGAECADKIRTRPMDDPDNGQYRDERCPAQEKSRDSITELIRNHGHEEFDSGSVVSISKELSKPRG